MTELNLNFMHPQYGTIFNADIDGTFTIAEMIQNLLLSGFLPAHTEGYNLALGDRVLEGSLRFEELDGIYDGDIIRVIALKGKKTQQVAKKEIWQLHLSHPNGQIALDFRAEPSHSPNNILENLVQRGFILGDKSNFELTIAGRRLSGDETIEIQKVKHLDFIQIVDKQAVLPIDTEVEFKDVKRQLGDVGDRIDTLEKGLSAQLEIIRENMPAPSVIPIDASQVINPTTDGYESVESMINEIRKLEGLPPTTKIRAQSWVPIILLGVLVIVAGFIGVFWNQISSLFGG